MKFSKRLLRPILWIIIFSILIPGLFWLCLPVLEFGTSEGPRAAILETAEKYLYALEGSKEHHTIIDGYNAHTPLAQGYMVTYEDDWCATFVSYCAIQAGLTELIPTECSCERQIGLWKELKRWEESDTYLPQSGDIIYYDWDVRSLGDSIGWADHVGIVVGTRGPLIKVIEGNMDDAVGYRYIIRWDPRIRGYGLPKYEEK